MKITFMTTATRDEALLETSCLRNTDFREIRVRPSLPQAIRDNRDVLYYGASHSVSNTDKVARCVNNARKELYELRYLFFDTSRNIDRVDWSTTVEYTDADYSAWKAAVTGKRVWAAVFTFNPYLLISINELTISIIHLLISINELLISIN